MIGKKENKSQTEMKYLQITYLMNDFYPKYLNSQILTIRKNSSIKDMHKHIYFFENSQILIFFLFSKEKRKYCLMPFSPTFESFVLYERKILVVFPAFPVVIILLPHALAMRSAYSELLLF